ncbi:MAG: hypothetical protein H0W89_03690 [Candidatus Levybacteria bacterium]|nr:hypothetical protein [Candidatus Levybacteria bacterium]
MSESGVGVLDRETTASAESEPQEKPARALEVAVREMEAQLERTKETEVRDEPDRIVLRDIKEWDQWGWEENERRKVRDGLIQVLGWDPQTVREERKAEAYAENTMEMLLAQGKTAQEVLGKLRVLLNATDPNDDVNKHLDQEVVTYSQTRRNFSEDKYRKHAILHDKKYGLGIEREDYIERFILSDEFRDDNQSDYDSTNPQGLEELAWQAGHDRSEFGVNGRYPILQMELVDVGGRVKGQYRVNHSNFIHWMRNRMMFYEDKTDDDLNNFFTVVKIEKDLRPITLDTITDEKERYFTDADGKVQGALYTEMLKEVLGLLYIRQYDLEYKTVMSSGEELTKKMGQMYAKNKITKKSFGKSSMYYMTTTPLDYKGDKADDKMGAAFTTMQLAMYNWADFDKLQEVLGKDSSFFTEKGMLAAVQVGIEKKYEMTGNTRDGSMEFLGEKIAKSYEKAFVPKKDKDGNIVKDANGNVVKTADKKGFIEFINYFGGLQFSKNLEDTLEEALKAAMAEKFNFESSQQNIKALDDDHGEAIVDKDSLKMAWWEAYSWLRFSGAATRSDTGYSAYDATRKLTGTEGYRRKMATEKRGNAFGNMYTVPMFKKLMLDFMQGVRVSEATTVPKDANGKPLVNKKGEVEPRNKSILEVFEEIVKEKRQSAPKRKELEDQIIQLKLEGKNPEEIKKKQKELDDLYAASKRKAAQLEFGENAMTDYVANHVARAQKVYDQLMSAEEINFDKFSKYDPLSRSVSFDKPEFQKKIQEEFLKPLRYLFDTYGQVNYNMMVREHVFTHRDEKDKDHFEFREIPMGEALFGHQMLDIPEFRMCEKDANGKDIEGKYVINQYGRHVIDYTKVQGGETLIFKQWAMTKLGADLLTHIDSRSKDPNYNVNYFRNVLEAVESIPAEVMGGEFNMKDTAITKKFFNKEQLRWFKKLSKTTEFQLFTRGLWADLRHKADGGISDSFSIFLNAIFRGY